MLQPGQLQVEIGTSSADIVIHSQADLAPAPEELGGHAWLTSMAAAPVIA